MQIKSILSQERTLANIEVSSKKRALETLAKLFSDTVEFIDSDELFKFMIERERLGTTGIGAGIAIPHCRFNTQGQTYGACLTLVNPIDFDAVDNRPVDLIFAMIVPQNAEKSHLETLATLAEKFQSTDFPQNLRSCKTNESLFHMAVE